MSKDNPFNDPRFPLLSGMATVPTLTIHNHPLQCPPGVRLDKAMRVQQVLSNFAYSRWNGAYRMVRKKIHDIQEHFMKEVARADQKSLVAHQELVGS
jgi:hypothetical protein